MNNGLKKIFSINLELYYRLMNDLYNDEVNQTDSLYFGPEFIYSRELKEIEHKKEVLKSYF